MKAYQVSPAFTYVKMTRILLSRVIPFIYSPKGEELPDL